MEIIKKGFWGYFQGDLIDILRNWTCWEVRFLQLRSYFCFVSQFATFVFRCFCSWTFFGKMLYFYFCCFPPY